jgi:hypothetical protein
LVAVSTTTHTVLWHRDIDPPRPNTATSYYVPAEQQRPALTLLGGRIYVEFGGLSGDCGLYHGYVVSVPSSGRGSQLTYQVPTATEGAIWSTGGALVTGAGTLMVATGNGASDTTFDEGDALISLSPTLARLGDWAPANWAQLNDDDADLGSDGPITVAGTSLVFVAGKALGGSNTGYLVNPNHLGGAGGAAVTATACPRGGSYGADATAQVLVGGTLTSVVYAPCTGGSGTEAMAVTTTPSVKLRQLWSTSGAGPNGPPILAGGWIWSVDTGANVVDAINPSTGVVHLHRATDPVVHFDTPAMGDGELVVATASGVEARSTTS